MEKLYISIFKINMAEEASLEFQLRKIGERKNYLLDEIKHNDLLHEKCKKTCNYLNYVEHLLLLVSTVVGWVLISAIASLVCFPIGITSSAVGMKICRITAGMKKHKSIIKKKKKKHDKIVLLGKDKLNSTEVLISMASINSHISHNKFVSVDNVLREYNEMKGEIKKP